MMSFSISPLMGTAVYTPAVILILPAVFTIAALFTRRHSAVSSLLAVSASLIVLFNLVLVFSERFVSGLPPMQMTVPWFCPGNPDAADTVKIGIFIDNYASAVSLAAVFAAVCIQIFSWGWFRCENASSEKKEFERTVSRFMAVSSLVLFAVLAAVFSVSLWQTAAAWMVISWGTCTLINLRRPFTTESNNAARRILIINFCSDILLVIGFLLLGSGIGSFDTAALMMSLSASAEGELPLMQSAEWGGLLIAAAAVVKSSQFPFHIELSEMCEAPLPSWLVIQSLCVSIGLLTILRLYPWICASPAEGAGTLGSAAVMWLGLLSALFASCAVWIHKDIRHITVSIAAVNLGTACAAAGLGSQVTASFQLIVFYLFQTLLAMGTSAVVLRTGRSSIFEIPCTKEKMPYTWFMMLIALAAAAGLPPLSIFWTQSSVLCDAAACSGLMGKAAAVILTVIYAMTAFGAMRMYLCAFENDASGAKAASGKSKKAADKSEDNALQEVPMPMWIIMQVLAAFALSLGLLNIPENLGVPVNSMFAEFINEFPAPLSTPAALCMFAIAALASISGVSASVKLYYSKNHDAGEQKLISLTSSVRPFFASNLNVEFLYKAWNSFLSRYPMRAAAFACAAEEHIGEGLVKSLDCSLRSWGGRINIEESDYLKYGIIMSVICLIVIILAIGIIDSDFIISWKNLCGLFSGGKN